jgi:two-component system cell cycle response regulator CpdR
VGQSKPYPRTALVVEDDDIQRDMISLLLEESFDVIIQCEDAETALLALKVRHPSLLVTDVSLIGNMNGVDLAHYARQNDPQIRVIVISGQPLPRPLPDNATFFSKPFLPTALLRELH